MYALIIYNQIINLIQHSVVCPSVHFYYEFSVIKAFEKRQI